MRARMAFAMHSPARAASPRTYWAPTDLGAALKAWWNADDTANGVVANWNDRVGAMVVTAAGAPASAAASFNGLKRGVSFDGVVDCFASTVLTTLPTGAVPGDLYVLASFTSSAATGVPAQYGGASGATIRRVHKSSTNQLLVFDGASGTAMIGVNIGPHIVGGMWAGTVQDGYLDGTHMDSNAPATIAPLATGTLRLRLGASSATTAAAFFLGVLRHVLITATLTTQQRQQLEGWLAWDGGIQGLLPFTHPYKGAPP